jgi:myo-inositol-1(or 4)-monophosphatase
MLALVGADTARQARQHIVGVAVDELQTKSSTVDLVTAADHETERALVEALSILRPDDAIIGEEGANSVGVTSLVWLIDPIDGTTNYVYDFPAWTTSVAVAERNPDGTMGPTLAGCVVDCAHGDVYLAGLGLGATCNGQTIKVRSTPSIETALVATGFAYVRNRRAQQVATVARVLAEVRDIRRAGSAALDCCWVGAGVVDAYYENHVRVWDVAAGLLIAAEAGATVNDWCGADPHTDEHLVWAASPAIAQPLSAIIQL